MRSFPVVLIEPDAIEGTDLPLSIVLVDVRGIRNAGVSAPDAARAVASLVDGPIAVNVIDPDALTTTSDGVLVQGAVVAMAAGDHGKVHPEFGFLPMRGRRFSEALVQEEPHLKQWSDWGTLRPLYRGPDLARKLIPVHNAVITGRAVNNNSASEMMNVVTMREVLFPIVGQLQLLQRKPVVVGPTGEHISVGIGMTVAEDNGRIFPTRQFRAGDTAHGSGEYAKTLKASIPCIAAPKRVLAQNILRALSAGMIPGRHLGCSPAVLAVARAVDAPIDLDNMTEGAFAELASVGITRQWLTTAPPPVYRDELLEEADSIIPGLEDGREFPADRIATIIDVPVSREAGG